MNALEFKKYTNLKDGIAAKRHRAKH